MQKIETENEGNDDFYLIRHKHIGKMENLGKPELIENEIPINAAKLMLMQLETASDAELEEMGDEVEIESLRTILEVKCEAGYMDTVKVSVLMMNSEFDLSKDSHSTQEDELDEESEYEGKCLLRVRGEQDKPIMEIIEEHAHPIVTRLLKKGYTVSEIARGTCLSKEKVKRILKMNRKKSRH